MQESIELVFDRCDDFVAAMTDVEASDATGKIEIAVAVDIFQPSIFRLGNVNRRTVRKAARDGSGAALGKGLRLWAGNWCAELNSRHCSS
jgi:hypothetical protein